MPYLGIEPRESSLVASDYSVPFGNLSFTSFSQRIVGDFSNNTHTFRTLFQTSIPNGNTLVGLIPNGAASRTSFQVYSNADPTISSTGTFAVNGNVDVRITSGSIGGGTELPLSMWTNNSPRITVDTNGRVLIGATTNNSISALQVYGSSGEASFGVKRSSNDASAGYIGIIKTRGTSPTDLTPVQAGDALGSVIFAATQGSGTISVAALDASISSSGTVNATSLPSVLTLATTPDGSTIGAERIRITSNGDTGIGTNAPPARLSARGRGTTANTYGFSVQDLNLNYNLLIADDGSITSANVASAVGYKGTPLNSQTANYTLVPDDQGKTIIHPITDNNARTFTIPSNANVAYPVGTVLSFINMANTITVAIAADTMYLAGTGNTAVRTLTAFGIASAIKLTSNTWMISGNGLN